MEQITLQVRSMAEATNEHGRKRLIDQLRDLAISLEQPQDSAQRLLYSQLPLMALRLGCDIDLFGLLTRLGRPATIDELASETGVQPTLLGRLLRYMASVRLIKEVQENTFVANNVTETFAMPGFKSGVYHYFDYVAPGFQHLPEFLRKTDYQDIQSSIDCPLMSAWGSELPSFLHYQTKPELFGHFCQYMTVQRFGMPTWLDVYPIEQAGEKTQDGKPLFVDIGGGFGHQSIALRERLQDAPGRIIVQDLAASLSQISSHPGVELMEQDFFEPQKVCGASIYYMRNIIHDWADEQALQILRNTRNALGPDSVILIDDMYLEERDVNWQAAQLDMTMMTCLSSRERTSGQWKDLISRAGLTVSKVYVYTESLRDSVIECVRSESAEE